MASKVKDEVAARQSATGPRGDIVAGPDAKAPAASPESGPTAPPQQLENNMVQQILERQAVFGF